MHLQHPLNKLFIREVSTDLAEGHLAYQHRVLLQEEGNLKQFLLIGQCASFPTRGLMLLKQLQELSGVLSEGVELVCVAVVVLLLEIGQDA